MRNSLGIYDSGIGGLSIVQSIRKAYPDMAITYLGDSKIMPLGEKPREYIRERLKSTVDYLFARNCPIVILACNTASVVGIRYLQETWVKTVRGGRHNLLGINKPLMETMSERHAYLKDKKGVLISTSATYDSGYYQNELEERGFYHVRAVSSSDLATAIEVGDRERIRSAVQRAVDKIRLPSQELQYVILACTHYPFALDEIRTFFRPDTEFIEPGPVVAEKLGDYLKRHREYLLNEGPVTYLTTGDLREFAGIVERVTGEVINPIHIQLSS